MENKEYEDQEKTKGTISSGSHEGDNTNGFINGEQDMNDIGHFDNDINTENTTTVNRDACDDIDHFDNDINTEHTTTVNRDACKSSNTDSEANFPSHIEEVNKTMEYTEKQDVERSLNTSRNKATEGEESINTDEREPSSEQRNGDMNPTKDNSATDGNTDSCEDYLRVLKHHNVDIVDLGTFNENKTDNTRTVRGNGNKVEFCTDATTLKESQSDGDRETTKVNCQKTENCETSLYVDSRRASSSDLADSRGQCPGLESEVCLDRDTNDSHLTHITHTANNQPILTPDTRADTFPPENLFSDASRESDRTPALETVDPVSSPDPSLSLQTPVQPVLSADSGQPGVSCDTSPHVESPPGPFVCQDDEQDTRGSDNEGENATCDRQKISDGGCGHGVMDRHLIVQDITVEAGEKDSDFEGVNHLADQQTLSLASSPGMDTTQSNCADKCEQLVTTSDPHTICDKGMPCDNEQSQALTGSDEAHTKLSSVSQSAGLVEEIELGNPPSCGIATARSSRNAMQNPEVEPRALSITHDMIQTSETERYLTQPAIIEVCKQEPDTLQTNTDYTDVHTDTGDILQDDTGDMLQDDTGDMLQDDTGDMLQDDTTRSHSSGSLQCESTASNSEESVPSPYTPKSILSKLHSVFGEKSHTPSSMLTPTPTPTPQSSHVAVQHDVGSSIDPTMTSRLDTSRAVQEGPREEGGSDDSSDTEFQDVTSRLSDHVIVQSKEKKSGLPLKGTLADDDDISDDDDDDDDDDFFDAVDDEGDDNPEANNTSTISTSQEADPQRQKCQERGDGPSPCTNDSSVCTQPEKRGSRRTHITEKPSMGLFSLWNVLKNCKGKELSKIAMPVNFNEPLSMLQRLTEELEYSEVLDRAAQCQDAGEQMSHVAAFTVSAYATTLYRTGKPFNPLLGETFEFDRTQDLGWWSLAEQVSHHPPTLATHAEGRGWTLWQEFTMTTRFRGRYVQVVPMGIAHLKFSESGHHYTWRKVTTTVHNIIVGRLWVDNEGDMTITNHSTQHTCHLHYHPYSYFSRHPHRQVTGEVKDENGVTRWTLSGTWCTQMEASPVVHTVREEEGEEEEEERQTSCYSSGSQKRSEENSSHTGPAQVLWNVRPPPDGSEKMYNLSRLALEMNEPEHGVAPTDSRLRPDQRSMEEGEWGEANRLKLLLEDKQRAARRRRQDNADIARCRQDNADIAVQQGVAVEEYQPTWFTKERDPDTDVALHVYTGRYWQCKQSQQWDTCPDIFL